MPELIPRLLDERVVEGSALPSRAALQVKRRRRPLGARWTRRGRVEGARTKSERETDGALHGMAESSEPCGEVKRCRALLLVQ